MGTFTVSTTSRVDAPAERIYAVIADYRDGHARILPPQYFSGLEVESGGVGEGTVIRCTMRVLGAERTLRAAVTEPEPGRVLTETDLANRVVTTFTVVPRADGAADVTIATLMRQQPGARGTVERWLSRWMLQRIYRDEFRLLASVVEA